MKVAVIIIGILGALAVMGLGGKWVGDYNKYHDSIVSMAQLAQQADSPELKDQLAKLEKISNAGMIMLGMGFLSLIAAILVGKLKKISAAVLLLTAIIPAILAPQSLIAGFLLIIAGVLALLVKPKMVQA